MEFAYFGLRFAEWMDVVPLFVAGTIKTKEKIKGET
jgi:hypothetical protein